MTYAKWRRSLRETPQLKQFPTRRDRPNGLLSMGNWELGLWLMELGMGHGELGNTDYHWFCHGISEKLGIGPSLQAPNYLS